MENNFQENLIKGKIVETIFQQMFLETEKYNVYPTGYETTLPQIAQLRHHKDIENILDQVRKTPDFVLVPKGKDEVYLVEVKYRHEYNNSELTTLAREIHDQWEYSWLFLASQNEFYFDSCWNIMNSNGHMDLLPVTWVAQDLQNKYHTLLHEFLG